MGRAEPCPYDRLGGIVENENNGIDQIHDYLQTDIILWMCVGGSTSSIIKKCHFDYFFHIGNHI